MRPLQDTPEWQALGAQAARLADFSLREAFARDSRRFERYSQEGAGLFLDYSKHWIDDGVLTALMALAKARGVEDYRRSMFEGERINLSERRSVLHSALRRPRREALKLEGQDLMPQVHAVLDHLRSFSDAVRSGAWTGWTGQPIRDVVNIGIGGSDLGPQMACQALAPYAHERLRVHFVSNVDGTQLEEVLAGVIPAQTLFVICSKAFNTQETMANAISARQWLLAKGAAPEDVARHFVAVSTRLDRVAEFGIDPANAFAFWDWVGGRYSLWSAVGLALVLQIGMQSFEALLSGAHEMDRHFLDSPAERNLPLLLGLLGVWYRGFFAAHSHCVAPYAHGLRRFPAYLQQLEMESNGKSVDRYGRAVGVRTCPVIWGEPGTNGQHAFFQLLHQGTDLIPVDFVLVGDSGSAWPEQHRLLLANGIAQSEALMLGKRDDEVLSELTEAGHSPEEAERLLPHKRFSGNRPSSTLLLEQLSPRFLGALIALYEHKVLVQGAIWGVNSFDQWGVELGKVLAGRIADELAGGQPTEHDSSTRGLMARVSRREAARSSH